MKFYFKYPLMLWIFALSISFSSMGYAQAEQEAEPRSQRARIILDRAIVYKEPHFDSSILTRLPEGKVFQVSAKTRGPFFMIRLGEKQFGWIADVDVETELQGRVAPKKDAPFPEVTEGSEDEMDQGTALFLGPMDDPYGEEEFEAIYFKKYVGLSVASFSFRERSFDGEQEADLLLYGIKIAGPEIILKGPGLSEVNIFYYNGAPSFYEDLTSNTASGGLLIADLMLTNPFIGGQNYMIYYSLGPMLRYSAFDVKLGESQLSLHNFNMGAVFELGGALDLGRAAIRIDYRYHWEVTRYDGWAFSFQLPF